METGRGGQQSCIAQTCALSMGVCVRGLEYFAVAIPPGTRSGVGRLKGCQLGLDWVPLSRWANLPKKSSTYSTLLSVCARGAVVWWM